MEHRQRASGVHDLGGTSGFGPVPIDDRGPFHESWQGRAFAVTQFAQAVSGFNTDAFRHGIEREDPDRYLELDYWAKWVRNAERMLIEGGVIATDAVDAALGGRVPVGQTERTTDAVPPAQRGSEASPEHPPRFGVGEWVRVLPKRTDGRHTRLPAYAEQRIGEVVACRGGWIFPDRHAHGEGPDPQWVYAVDFAAADLWPDAGTHRVRIDLFEPYLERT
ncbi:MAG: nitrile hydratase subunit beta [Acidimicrobiales bacterium]